MMLMMVAYHLLLLARHNANAASSSSSSSGSSVEPINREIIAKTTFEESRMPLSAMNYFVRHRDNSVKSSSIGKNSDEIIKKAPIELAADNGDGDGEKIDKIKRAINSTAMRIRTCNAKIKHDKKTAAAVAAAAAAAAPPPVEETRSQQNNTAWALKKAALMLCTGLISAVYFYRNKRNYKPLINEDEPYETEDGTEDKDDEEEYEEEEEEEDDEEEEEVRELILDI